MAERKILKHPAFFSVSLTEKEGPDQHGFIEYARGDLLLFATFSIKTADLRKIENDARAAQRQELDDIENSPTESQSVKESARRRKRQLDDAELAAEDIETELDTDIGGGSGNGGGPGKGKSRKLTTGKGRP